MALTQFKGTADVPRRYWKVAKLIGETPFMASSYDQRASYCMYIPEAHYQVDAERKLPLIVNVHSSHRRAERCRDSMIDLADRVQVAVLAPLFPAGIPNANDPWNYNFLRHSDIRYDLVLLSMIDEVAKRWPGVETEKFYLVGFSGGGQFVSRFYFLHPHKLYGVSIGAPGLVTKLDTSLVWPRGLKNVEQHFDGLSVDIDALKSVSNVQLIVGDRDVQSADDGLLDWLTAKGTDDHRLKAVGTRLTSRTEQIAELRDELLSVGVKVQYHVVPGVAHEGMKLLPTVIAFLESALKSQK